jgi:hypothetical protein
MKTVGELLSRNLDCKIEEIIKVDQTDEQSVHDEISEYVATGSIKDQYAQLLKAVAEASAEPHEGIGVWISGFFGSGKSSFAKNLGYILQNRPVLGTPFSELFKKQIEDHRLAEFIDLVNVRIPTEAVMFDVSVDRATKKNSERIAELMYTVLLRELDYAEDFDIAELEFELEKEGKLTEFVSRCGQRYGEWRIVRKGAQKVARASAVLHELDPPTYPAADSWSRSLGSKVADISVGKLVERAFEMFARRRPGKALVFVIDEVGQYVARSADKIEDLRAVVEQFGKVGKNRLKARKVIAPCWIIVTSQEKLDEVVAAIDSKRVELAKLQDRFKYRVDLAPSDIREVATKRVLAKKPASVPVLRALYRENQGQLNAACRLERTSRKTEVGEDDFVQFYPYLPHFVELSIAIMSGIRLQPGAPRHYGGSNRTIIKQAYEMLVSDRTALAKQPVGTLVTLDKIYELVEGNLSVEKRTDIHDIRQRFKDDPGEWSTRVAKAVCLLEFVRDLPRTESNIAACLVDALGKPAPLAEVKTAVEKLHKAQFIRTTEDGWKLQTAQEKNWDTERRGHLEPKPRDRNEIVRQILREIFGEPDMRVYRHQTFRNFRIGIAIEGTPIGDEGDISLLLHIADDDEDFTKRALDAVRNESRQESHRDDLYWAYALTPEIDELVAQVYASRQMVAKYEQLRGQTEITKDEITCLQDEKTAALRYQSRLTDKLTAAMEKGQGVFRGVARDAPSLGKLLPEILRTFLSLVVPDLYPKLEIGSRPLKGTEADELLKAVDLKGLPQVFYSGEQGLNLVVKDGAKHVPNPDADVCKEVLQHLVAEHGYGNRDSRTGKALESKFGGVGYGWDRDMLRLILAVVFRAGAIEVSHGGQKFDSFADPRSRQPFVNNTAFKSALFTPIKPIDLKTLRRAVDAFEDLTGNTVDMDKNAIAAALKKLAEDELKFIVPVEAVAKANSLAVVSTLGDYTATMNAVVTASADDSVKTLAGEGATLKEARDQVRKIAAALDEPGLATIHLARTAAGEMWTVLESHGHAHLRTQADELKNLLASERFYESMPTIRSAAGTLTAAYSKLYTENHDRRAKESTSAVEEVKGHSDWSSVPVTMQQPVLQQLVARACEKLELPDGTLTCRTCRATVSQMESDLAALDGLKAQAVAQVVKLTTPVETKVVRVRLASFFATSDSENSIKAAVERLLDHLLKLHQEGVKIVVE